MTEVAKAIGPDCEHPVVGIRPGEKLHEEMISPDDSRRTLRLGNRYVVMPTVAEWGYQEPKGEFVVDGFSYRSDNNDLWLTSNQLIEMISKIEKSN